MERYNEYRYRRLFQCSHDEYLDTPFEDIEWMLHLDKVVGEAQSTRSGPPSAPQGPPQPFVPTIN